MIWSVSTLLRGSGAARPAIVETFLMTKSSRRRSALRSQLPRPSRADQVGAAAAALPPFEVAVRGRGAALAWQQDVRVHAEAHGAAGVAPFKAGGLEDLVEAFGLGLQSSPGRTRHDHGVDAVFDLFALDHCCGGP